MEEIDFEVSSPAIQVLASLAEEYGVKEYLYSKTLIKNRHFVVFIPPVAEGDVNSADNIYIDDDFVHYDNYDDDYDYDEDDAESYSPMSYTLRYGMSHIHFEAGTAEDECERAARQTLQMVKDIIDGKVLSFHLKAESGLEVTGYTENKSEQELKEKFASYGKGCVRLCGWNNKSIKVIEI